MPELLLNRTRDRPPTAVEVANDIRALGFSRAGGFMTGHRRNGVFCAYIGAFCDPDDQYSANYLGGNQSELEFHQRDHVIVGFAMAATEPDSYWEALADAKRGRTEKRSLCLWVDRGSPTEPPTFKYFRRARRLYPSFRPIGPEISALEFLSIIALR